MISDDMKSLSKILGCSVGHSNNYVNAFEVIISYDKATQFLATIAADRQQIENLKLDLHVANRALEIDPATVDLRKRIAELEKQAEIKDTLVRGVIVSAELHEQLEDAKARITELKERNLKLFKDVLTLKKNLGEYAELCMSDITQKKRIKELEAENQRLRDLLLEAIKWVDKYDWNQARGLEYKLKQALCPQGEEKKCEK